MALRLNDIYTNRKAYEFDERSQLDERMSQQSTSSKRNSSDSLKAKLREPNAYTTDDAIDIVEKSGKGLDIGAAQKLAKSARTTVEGMQITLPKTLGSSKGVTNSDTQVGQALTDHIQNMIVQGGEALVAIVKTNLDLDEFVDERRQVIQGLDDNIRELEKSRVEVDDPSKEVMELQLKHKVLAKKKQLLEIFQQQFAERMRQNLITGLQASRSQESRSDMLEAEEAGNSVQLEDWEGSKEEVDYKGTLLQFELEAREQLELKFLEEYTQAREAKKERSQAIVRIADFKVEIVKQQVVELMATELKNLKTIIVQKIISAISDNSTMKTRLNQNVLVCNEAIEQPYESQNLSGIYQILLDVYSKASISFMCDYLLDLLSVMATAEDVERNPDVMVTKMAPRIKQFSDMRLSSYLTQNMLFVVSLLKGYPQATRQDILRVLYVELQARETDPHRAIRAESYPGLPMYSIVVNYISEILVKSKQFVSASADKPDKPKASWTPKPKDGELESAAFGNEDMSGKGQGGGFGKTQRDRKLYRGEVHHAHQMRVPRGNRDVKYTATNRPCHNCTHVPNCFPGQCPKCQKYGHREDQCHQQLPETSGGGAGGRSV